MISSVQTMTEGAENALRDLDKNVRIQAAIDLGTAGDDKALDALVSALATEPDFFVRESITWALVRIGAPVVPQMIRLVEDGDPTVQLSAVHVLGKLGDSAAAPALIQALKGAPPEIRDRIVFSLGQIGDPEALPALVALIGKDRTESASTLTASIERFGEAAFDALVSRLEDADAEVRCQVVDLLGFMASPKAVEPLSRALSDHQPDVRLRALTGLAHTMPQTGDGAADDRRLAALRAVRDASSGPDRRMQLLAERVLQDSERPQRRRARPKF